jgi:hypothetical protein
MLKRFRPVVGPGLIIALAISVFYVWRRMQPPQVARPVVIQHEGAIAATGVPDPLFVADHAGDLKLSADQQAKVRKLADEYTKQTASLRKALDKSGHDTGAKLDQSSEKPPTPTELKEATQGISELSGLLAEARAGAWTGLQQVLTAEQQAAARQAWADAHTLRFPPARGEGGG